MPSRGVAAVAARWVAVAVALAVPAVGAHAATAPSAPPPTTIVVQPVPPSLPAPVRYGYDVKQGGKPDEFDRTLASHHFGSGGPFAVLRIPVYAGDHPSDAGQPDPSPEHLDTALYAPVVAAAQEALRVNPDLLVYANVKTPFRGNLFAPWLRGPDFPAHYARLLFNFVAYMQAHGVPVDALGIFNELSPAVMATYDGGRMSYADAYADTIRRLRGLIRVSHNPYAPTRAVKPVGTYVGPDSWHPHNDLVARLDGSGRGDTVNVEATHFYSRDLSKESAQLSKFDAWANGRGKWDTEFHWSQGRRHAHGYAEARDALFSVFSTFDHGLNTLIWWNFGDESSADGDYAVQADIQEHLVDTTAGMSYLPPPTGSGLAATPAPGGLVARAFVDATATGARRVQLWIVNDTPRTRETVAVTTATRAGLGDVASRSWVADAHGQLSAGSATTQTQVAGSSIIIGRIPARSLTAVTFTVAG